MSELSVNVKGLTKRFGDFTAVDGVDFAIPRGSIFGFLGPNGAGKSTVIRMLLGIIPPSEGEGTVLGCNIRTDSQEIRSRVGYMAQKFSLYEDLTVRENLNFFAGLFGAEARVGEMLERARLEEFERRAARELPGGVRQRLALAVALVHDPELVFLDEPTGSVDPALRRYFWELIVKLSREGKTVMVTSHYMDEVERCDTICFIHSGRLIARGSPGQLKRSLQGEMLSLQVKDRSRALTVLEELPGVTNPFPSGTSVRFLSTADRGELSVLLAARGLPEARPTAPNLEDVFISLTRGSAS